MVELLHDINKRTQLVGENRFELLLFSLGDKCHFGINVFKVREVIPCPPVRHHPGSHAFVEGIAHVRGGAIPVINLSRVFERGSACAHRPSYLIVTEFNRRVQGFLAQSVERIVNLNWQDVLPPPEQTTRSGYVTAIVELDSRLVEVVDVEKVLSDVVGENAELSEEIVNALDSEVAEGKSVMVVDDSQVARSQIKRALEQIGVQCMLVNDGQAALEMLRQKAGEGSLDQFVQLIISDIEMPRMDGYTLTSEVRRDPALAHLRIMLHSSLSGGFNQAMVDKVGADYWLPKFSSNELAESIVAILADHRSELS